MKKKLSILLALAVIIAALTLSVSAAGVGEEPTKEAELNSEGVTIVESGADNTVFNIGENQVVMISGQHTEAGSPIVFKNCKFVLSDTTLKISGAQNGENGHANISYYSGEVATKLWIGGNVEFRNCTFVTASGAGKSTSAGYDAAIYFFGGDINLYDCELKAEGYNGQFLGLYGTSGAVTFDNCDISTVGNKNGWSYAMYGASVLKLVNESTMSATGMTVDSGNTNAFYGGDNRTGSDAIFIDNSTVNFSDNKAGGFAINNVNIHVTNGSTIKVNNNLGNACNSGNWIVDKSTIQMNGNRGGHALSCIGFDMTDSTLEILHNGYAGVYLQSRDSSLENCTVDIRCNGEKLLSYTAGDVWLNSHKLTVSGADTTSEAYEGAAWLGGVGRTGAVVTDEGSAIVAYDLNSNAADNLKSNTRPVLTNANIAETDSHTLFLNPFMETDYARGNAEESKSDNDADLFKDDNVTDDTDIIGADNAEIGVLTHAQLAHHKYDWNNGVITADADENNYGVLRYACVDVCADYTNATSSHPYSFNCEGTYVYAPLVGIGFNANLPKGVDSAALANMPENQTDIAYNGTGTAPSTNPTLEGYAFAGWTYDEAGEKPFSFDTPLTKNWTKLYAQWASMDEALTVKPANITIYVGGDGYEGVVDGSGAEPTENSMPTPLFYVSLPNGVEVDNVAAEVVLTGNDGRKWEFEHAGYDASGKGLYYINSTGSVGEQGQDPVRVTYSIGDETHVSDEFDPTTVGEMFRDYTVAIYSGAATNVTATIDGSTYAVVTATGTLRVRAVDDTEGGNNPVVDVTDTVDAPVAPGEAAITAPEGTTYKLNNTTVPANELDIGLLFDGIIDDATNNRTQALVDRAEEEIGSFDNYQAQYLDLVDTGNGNAWVTASNSVTVHWGYPAGTNSDTEFVLLHFKDLHRDSVGGENESGFDISDVDTCTVEEINITNGENGITFSIGSGGFSPFVLVWNDDGSTPGDPDEPVNPPIKPEKPGGLNTEDHVAYIIGYPDGEVKPEGNITRAEVATIFFRLLTDETRDEYWSKTNSYTDVPADSWFNNAISTLSNMGIIDGYADGSFRPDAPITRAEFTKIAVSFFEYADYVYENTFTDVRSGSWYTQFIAAAVEIGLIEGYPDGTFRPDNYITRAEACTIVNRTLNRAPDEDHLLPESVMITWPDNQPGTWYYADMQEATNSHDYDWLGSIEDWTEKLEERDWEALEKLWSDSHDAPGGEVMG